MLESVNYLHRNSIANLRGNALLHEDGLASTDADAGLASCQNLLLPRPLLMQALSCLSICDLVSPIRVCHVLHISAKPVLLQQILAGIQDPSHAKIWLGSKQMQVKGCRALSVAGQRQRKDAETQCKLLNLLPVAVLKDYGPSVLQALAMALEYPDWHVRQESLQTAFHLSCLGMDMTTLIPNFYAQLLDHDFSVRSAAAFALPVLVDQEIHMLVRAIRKALEDTNWRVRQSTLEGLVARSVPIPNDRRLVAAVLAAAIRSANHKEMCVRCAALRALPHVAASDDPEVMGAVHSLLQEGELHETIHIVLLEVLPGLVSECDMRTAALLISRLQNFNRNVRVAAVHCLAQLNGSYQNDRMRMIVSTAIQNVRCNDREWPVREAATLALEALGERNGQISSSLDSCWRWLIHEPNVLPSLDYCTSNDACIPLDWPALPRLELR